MPLIKNKYEKAGSVSCGFTATATPTRSASSTSRPCSRATSRRAYTDADNSTSVSTDTIKNVVNVVARENTGLSTEEFCQVLAKKYLDSYPQVTSVAVTAHETKWSRMSFGGKPHPHSFVLDSNGKPFVEATATREGATTLASGVDSFTFMKSTQSGWENYYKDRYTTIPPTQRPDVRHQHGGVLEMVGEACELSGRQCQNPGHAAGGVRDDL